MRALDAAAQAGREACAILLQEDTPDASLREAVWDKIPKATLQTAVATITQVTQSSASDEQHAVAALYTRFYDL